MAIDLINVTVRIYGWDYTLRVDPAHADRAKAIAAHLDQKMNQVARASHSADTLRIAIRSALLITDELFETRDKLEQAKTGQQNLFNPGVDTYQRKYQPDVPVYKIPDVPAEETVPEENAMSQEEKSDEPPPVLPDSFSGPTFDLSKFEALDALLDKELQDLGNDTEEK